MARRLASQLSPFLAPASASAAALPFVGHSAVRQSNGVDCGPYTVLFAEEAARWLQAREDAKEEGPSVDAWLQRRLPASAAALCRQALRQRLLEQKRRAEKASEG